jgi:hypothetical protein
MTDALLKLQKEAVELLRQRLEGVIPVEDFPANIETYQLRHPKGVALVRLGDFIPRPRQGSVTLVDGEVIVSVQARSTNGSEGVYAYASMVVNELHMTAVDCVKHRLCASTFEWTGTRYAGYSQTIWQLDVAFSVTFVALFKHQEA